MLFARSYKSRMLSLLHIQILCPKIHILLDDKMINFDSAHKLPWICVFPCLPFARLLQRPTEQCQQSHNNLSTQKILFMIDNQEAGTGTPLDWPRHLSASSASREDFLLKRGYFHCAVSRLSAKRFANLKRFLFLFSLPSRASAKSFAKFPSTALEKESDKKRKVAMLSYSAVTTDEDASLTAISTELVRHLQVPFMSAE